MQTGCAPRSASYSRIIATSDARKGSSSTEQPTDAVGFLIGFAAALRTAGLRVSVSETENLCRAAALLPLGELYWAGRLCAVSRREDVPIYDRVFAQYFGDGDGGTVDGSERSGETAEGTGVAASPLDVLHRKSFSACSTEELGELLRHYDARRLAPMRRTRRQSPRRHGPLDLRATVRRALRNGGRPVKPARRGRRLAPRRTVFLLDISGSMSEYSRNLLVVAHATLRQLPKTEIYCFGTRLTRLTEALRVRDVDEGLAQVASLVDDWDGGTRIGEALDGLMSTAANASVVRGGIVVICSDGLEVGDPALLGAQMAKLRRLARLVVWLNPLRDDPGYEPLARGMAAALPSVDVFATGQNLASLDTVAASIAAALRSAAGTRSRDVRARGGAVGRGR